MLLETSGDNCIFLKKWKGCSDVYSNVVSHFFFSLHHKISLFLSYICLFLNEIICCNVQINYITVTFLLPVLIKQELIHSFIT